MPCNRGDQRLRRRVLAVLEHLNKLFPRERLMHSITLLLATNGSKGERHCAVTETLH